MGDRTQSLNLFLDREGNRVSRMDENREIWYAARGGCGYWTDDWSQLRSLDTGIDNGGIPCCPICGCVGMQTTAKDWFEGAKQFEEGGKPGYQEFVRDSRQVCRTASGISFMKAYENEKQKR